MAALAIAALAIAINPKPRFDLCIFANHISTLSRPRRKAA
jgi:hypothetical protein